MTTTFTRDQTIARRFTEAAVKERRQDAIRFMDAALEMIEQGVDLGVSKDFLHDTATGLRDQLSNLCAGMAKDLDSVGLVDVEPLDLSDLDLLIEAMS